MNLKLCLRCCTIIACGFLFLKSREALAWTEPTQISNGGMNMKPSLMINNSGNAVAAWTQGAYPSLNIQASTYTSGIWSSPTTINTSGINDAVIVKIDSAGNIVAIWEDLAGGERVVMEAVKPVSMPWSLPSILSNSNANYFSHLAMNENGQAVATWCDYTNNLVKVSTLTFGDSWSAPITLTPGLGAQKEYSKAEIDSTGNAFVVWKESDTGDISLSQTVDGFESSWSVPIVLAPSGTDPSISSSSTGDAVVSSSSLLSNEISAVTYSDEIWSSPVVLSNEFSQLSTAKSFDADAFVVFQNSTTGHIQASNFNGGIWDPPVNLSSSTNNQIPVISVDPTGTAFVAWSDSGSGEIKVTQFPDGGIPSAPQVISSEIVNVDPAISSGTSGEIAVWGTYIDTDLVIQASVN